MNIRRNLGSLIVFLLIVAASWFLTGGPEERHPSEESASPSASLSRAALAYERKESNVWIEDNGVVETLLRDDNEGSRHQRFIVRLAGGTSLLVSHNIDLAPRIPVKKGDTISFRGEYEWNDKGGVVHWTHHDPRGRKSGGWIRHLDVDYR